MNCCFPKRKHITRSGSMTKNWPIKKRKKILYIRIVTCQENLKLPLAIPPNNDVDVFGNDLGLIAIIENNELKGYNIAIGGGLSSTHGNPATYPRLATVIGFVSGEEKILKTIYEIVTIQRDYGNRSDRSLARLKYTVDKMGIEWFKAEIARRTGFSTGKRKTVSIHGTERLLWLVSEQ